MQVAAVVAEATVPEANTAPSGLMLIKPHSKSEAAKVYLEVKLKVR